MTELRQLGTQTDVLVFGGVTLRLQADVSAGSGAQDLTGWTPIVGGDSGATTDMPEPTSGQVFMLLTAAQTLALVGDEESVDVPYRFWIADDDDNVYPLLYGKIHIIK